MFSDLNTETSHLKMDHGALRQHIERFVKLSDYEFANTSPVFPSGISKKEAPV
jgi:hypothetical protein